MLALCVVALVARLAQGQRDIDATPAIKVDAPTCTGTADPTAATPFCYTGGELGEHVVLKVTSFASSAGTFDVTGSGIETISCLGKKFTKSGQTLTTDLSDCVHTIGIDSMAYCSDQDKVLVNAKVGPLPAHVLLSRTDCPSMAPVVVPQVAAPTCTGSADPPAPTPFCYNGGELGEHVLLKVTSFANSAGTFDVTGSGIETISCLGKKFTKSGQTLTTDLSDCVHTIGIDSMAYCSDQDKVLVNAKVGPLPAHVLLSKTDCPSVAPVVVPQVAAPTCTGAADPPAPTPFCYDGGELGEHVLLKVTSFANSAGTFDVTGSGIETISCLGKKFTKSGQTLTTDLSDCVHTIGIDSMAYCSDQDKVLVNAKVGPLPAHVLLSKTDCPTAAPVVVPQIAAPTCTGTADPTAATPFCYNGGELGETVLLKVTSFADSAGTFDVTGSGIETISCLGKKFTKSGQTLTTDLSDCVHTIGIDSMAYCSDQDKVLVNAKVGPLPAHVLLSRADCPSIAPAVPQIAAPTCTGTADPTAATPFCYNGGELGEHVLLKVTSFASSAGTFDVTGSGIETISCLGKKFTKSGQTLAADLSDCVHTIGIDSMAYCSDQDKVLVNAKVGPLPAHVLLSKTDCPSVAPVVLLPQVAAPTCTGTADPTAATPFCYSGGELGEHVLLKVTSFANSAGTFDVTGSGIETISCLNKKFTKSGQKLTADLSDCVHTIGIDSMAFCSDQDKVLVNAKVGPLPAAVLLSKTDCGGGLVVV